MAHPRSTATGYRSAVAEKTANVLLVVILLGVLAFAGWLATTATGVAGGIVLFLAGTFLGLIPASGLFVAVNYLCQTPQKNALDRRPACAETPTSEVPLSQWRGLGVMSRAAYVQAHCAACQHRWGLDTKVANTIAEAQNLGNRLASWGTKTEQLGATFTAGASGRRIAAGLESERQQQNLANVLSLAACPACGRVDAVHLRK